MAIMICRSGLERSGDIAVLQPRSKVSMIVIRPPQQGARAVRNIDSLFLLKAPSPSLTAEGPINLTAEARQYPPFPLGLGSERLKGTFLVAIMVEKTVRGRW